MRRSIAILACLSAVLFADSFSGGAGGRSAVPLYAQISSVTVGNTVTETSVITSGAGSVVIPPNYFAAGTSLVIRVWGLHTATGNPTIQWRVKIGGVVVLDTTAITSQTSTNQAFDVDGVVTCRTAGVSGTFFGQGKYIEVGNALFPMSNTAAQTINTTIQQTLDITEQWGTANPGDTQTTTNIVIDAKFPNL